MGPRPHLLSWVRGLWWWRVEISARFPFGLGGRRYRRMGPRPQLLSWVRGLWWWRVEISALSPIRVGRTAVSTDGTSTPVTLVGQGLMVVAGRDFRPVSHSGWADAVSTVKPRPHLLLQVRAHGRGRPGSPPASHSGWADAVSTVKPRPHLLLQVRAHGRGRPGSPPVSHLGRELAQL